MSTTPYADDKAPGWPEGTTVEVEAPTVENLMRHYNRYGLDNSKTGYKGTAQTYTGYATLRGDALVHVARTYLGVESYVQLLDLIGYGQFEEAARKDHAKLHSTEVHDNA